MPEWTKGHPPAMPGVYWWWDEANYMPRPIQQVGFGFYMELGDEGLQPLSDLPTDGYHMPADIPAPPQR